MKKKFGFPRERVTGSEVKLLMLLLLSITTYIVYIRGLNYMVVWFKFQELSVYCENDS